MMRLRRSSCKLNLFAILVVGDTANYENKRKNLKESRSFIIPRYIDENLEETVFQYKSLQ